MRIGGNNENNENDLYNEYNENSDNKNDSIDKNSVTTDKNGSIDGEDNGYQWITLDDDTDDNTDVDVESDAADVVIEDADEKSESAAFESGEDDDYKADADDVSDENGTTN
ncbi:MAG: hypothetical protein WAO54_05205, partial [Eubacteriales bacterium]